LPEDTAFFGPEVLEGEEDGLEVEGGGHNGYLLIVNGYLLLEIGDCN
jgi:hypothetical protein